MWKKLQQSWNRPHNQGLEHFCVPQSSFGSPSLHPWSLATTDLCSFHIGLPFPALILNPKCPRLQKMAPRCLQLFLSSWLTISLWEGVEKLLDSFPSSAASQVPGIYKSLNGVGELGKRSWADGEELVLCGWGHGLPSTHPSKSWGGQAEKHLEPGLLCWPTLQNINSSQRHTTNSVQNVPVPGFLPGFSMTSTLGDWTWGKGQRV